MSSALVLLAALGFAEASTLAEMVSNYAKVSTNTDLTTPRNANGYTSPMVTTTTTNALATPLNETEYEDFDDFEPDGDVTDRQQPIGNEKIFGYLNGLVSLLTLMYKFSGGSGRRDSVGEARYVPDAATKKFKQQADQERNPISNFPPYDPLGANTAESYSQNGGKTSFEADQDQYKTGVGDYGSDSQSSGGWNAIGHDYPVYEPVKMWQKDPEMKQPWQTQDEYLSFHPPPPEKPPADLPEYLIHGDDDHHYQHHHFEHDVEDEDRESKRPYSYYFLGRKLWYIPLIFSVYFIIYIAALVLKSVARHKIQFPDKLWDLKDEHYKHRRYRKVDEITEKYENAIDKVKYKFM